MHNITHFSRDDENNCRNSHIYRSVTNFTNDVSLTILIQSKCHIGVLHFLLLWPQHMFAHAARSQLSCHVQNFVAVTLLELVDQNEISIEFDL